VEDGVGGSVTSSSGWFDAGSEVTISSTPDSGFTFSSWIGSGSGSYSGSNSSHTVTLNGPITEKPVFLDIADPIANAGHDRTSKVGKIVVFNAMGSIDNVGIVNYEWDFGDGNTETFLATTHVYNEPGTYTVTLTVKDRVGNSAKDTVLITVEDITEPFVKKWGFPIWILYLIGFGIFMIIIFILMVKYS
jgi:PKD repeat protein